MMVVMTLKDRVADLMSRDFDSLAIARGLGVDRMLIEDVTEEIERDVGWQAA